MRDDEIIEIAIHLIGLQHYTLTDLPLRNLLGSYHIKSQAMNNVKAATTRCATPQHAHYYEDPLIEHLIVDHGISDIYFGTKPQAFHRKDHEDELPMFIVVPHEHSEEELAA